MVPVVAEPKIGPENDTKSETKGVTKSEANGNSTTTTSFCWWLKRCFFLLLLLC